MNITLDKSSIGLISSFSASTKSKVKDMIEDNGLIIFVVEQGELFRALGKKGANVKKLSQKLNKRIKVVEYSPDVKTFIINMIYPLKVAEITQEGGIITLHGDDIKTKGLLIGRNARNLRLLERVVKRYFDVDEIKVV
jgi:N utilization substance protein A